ncbi:Protein MAIN-LIKE 2 [Glycine max]|nr:Protein MAIN-LIKE 2 [Glycine max]
MVRTRGGPCALGSGTGRGMGQDEHDVHVTEEVPQVTEDVPPQVTKDIPDVTEDVPHVDEDMTTVHVDATDVAADGVEGSPVDHGQGFLGGPRDTSERPELKLVSHGRKVDKIGSPTLEIEGLVAGTELSPLIGCSVVVGDLGWISAFAERWHRESNTLHLLVGELTITLDDVACLLHLPITGALHRFEPLAMDEVVLLLIELLEEARAETVHAHGAYVRLSWLRDVYENRCQARCWIVAACAYLLHLVGCTLFANKSLTHVHVVHLGAFRDLGQFGGYAWGVAALVHMYDQLNEASQTPTRQMGGYLTLLQCWIYEYFPSVHQCVIDDAYAETTPRAYRWLTTKVHMKGIKGASYRARLDALTITDVSWLPYSEHREVRGFELISCYQGQLRWGHLVVYVRPERVSCEGCEVISATTERLERVLNLRMVPIGTKLHDIMEDCLWLAKGEAFAGSLRVRRRQHID